MSKSSNGKLKWLEAGYKLFGQIGPPALNIEHLSILLATSRSSFYHYFGDINFYEEDLLAYHLDRFASVAEKADTCKSFDPDLIEVIIEFDNEMLFQRQLLIHESNQKYKQCYLDAKLKTEEKVYSMWSEYMLLDEHSKEHFSLFSVVRDYYLLHYKKEDTRAIVSVVEDIQRLIDGKS